MKDEKEKSDHGVVYDMEDIALLVVMVVPWLMGLVLAEGFWQTAFAFFPPYAWYLATEWVMFGSSCIQEGS